MMLRTWSRRQRVALIVALVTVVGSVAVLLFGGGQASARALAEARWQQQPVPHYELATRESIGGKTCGQRVEVRDEEIKRIINDTCEYPTLWSISRLHRYVERASTVAERCSRLVIGTGCICNEGVRVRVAYDTARGIPREIIRSERWVPNWQSTEYWQYIWRYREIPDCTMPIDDLGRRVQVVELKPLP